MNKKLPINLLQIIFCLGDVACGYVSNKIPDDRIILNKGTAPPLIAHGNHLTVRAIIDDPVVFFNLTLHECFERLKGELDCLVRAIQKDLLDYPEKRLLFLYIEEDLSFPSHCSAENRGHKGISMITGILYRASFHSKKGELQFDCRYLLQ